MPLSALTPYEIASAAAAIDARQPPAALRCTGLPYHTAMSAIPSLAHHLLTEAYHNAWANHRLLRACAEPGFDEAAIRGELARPA